MLHSTIINEYLEENHPTLGTTDDIDDVLILIYEERYSFDAKMKEVIISHITDAKLKDYLDIAWKYMCEQHNRRRYMNWREEIKNRINQELSIENPSEEFEKACKSYNAFKKYTPANNEEAAILERIWSCRVVQFSRLVQYKNPVVYHIPMGGMNKK